MSKNRSGVTRRSRVHRLANPLEAAGYWRLQAPLTREARMRLATDEEAFCALQVVGGSIAYCMTRPGRAVAEAEEIAAGAPRHPRPAQAGVRAGWRWQWPLRHVPAGCRLIGVHDFRLQERALVAGIRRGLQDRAASTGGAWDEVPAGER